MVNEELNKILEEIEANFTLNDMILSRIDLCVNVETESERIVDAYLRVFKKCRLPYSYKIMTFSKDYINYKKKNQKSFRATNQGSTLTIYDKTYQIREEKLDASLDFTESYVVRIEVELKRSELAYIIKDILLIDDTILNEELLYVIGENSKLILTEYLSKFFLKGEYLTYDNAKKIVESSDYKKKIKRRMKLLLEKVSECKNMNAAINKIREYETLNNYQIKNLIDRFDELDINPVTLCNSEDIKWLPSIYELLGIII
jgi:hypothetical protein